MAWDFCHSKVSISSLLSIVLSFTIIKCLMDFYPVNNCSNTRITDKSKDKSRSNFSAVILVVTSGKMSALNINRTVPLRPLSCYFIIVKGPF